MVSYRIAIILQKSDYPQSGISGNWYSKGGKLLFEGVDTAEEALSQGCYYAPDLNELSLALEPHIRGMAKQPKEGGIGYVWIVQEQKVNDEGQTMIADGDTLVDAMGMLWAGLARRAKEAGKSPAILLK